MPHPHMTLIWQTPSPHQTLLPVIGPVLLLMFRLVSAYFLSQNTIKSAEISRLFHQPNQPIKRGQSITAGKSSSRFLGSCHCRRSERYISSELSTGHLILELSLLPTELNISKCKYRHHQTLLNCRVIKLRLCPKDIWRINYRENFDTNLMILINPSLTHVGYCSTYDFLWTN
jgi:hypothetical protein